VQARQEQQRASTAAKADAEQAARVLKELTRARAADAERQKAEQKIADKKAAEQAVIDRKRWTAQQVEAARVKEAADKLAKEQKEKQDAQDKLAKEQAARQEELSRLVEQYKKLTGVPPATQPTQ
jgi:soluble lytic murein transglycosylase-like protein